MGSITTMIDQQAEIARLQAELAAEVAHADRLAIVLMNVNPDTGYCCCGEPVDSHSGHSPVDAGGYHAGLALAAHKARRGG